MNPHPRIRKTAKWGGLALTLLLLVVWLGSGWWYVDWCVSSRVECVLIQGTFGVQWWPIGQGPFTPGEPDVFLDPFRGGYQLHWWDWGGSAANGSSFSFPVWVVVLPGAALTAFAWRRDTLARRRARVGACPHCGYSRAGLAPEAICPECGKGPSAGAAGGSQPPA